MAQPEAQPSHYDLLDVERDASPDTLRVAYRRAAQRHHPDRNGGDGGAMARINEAYAVLSHPQRRASYDQWMRAVEARLLAEAAAQAARPSRFAESWPWGLVAATTAVAFLAVGTVLYKTSASTAGVAARTAATQVAPGR
jgi:hypothetical protein